MRNQGFSVPTFLSIHHPAAANRPTEATSVVEAPMYGPAFWYAEARFDSPSSSSPRRFRSSGVIGFPPALSPGFSCEYREEGRNRIAVPPEPVNAAGPPPGLGLHGLGEGLPGSLHRRLDVLVRVGGREEGGLELGGRKVDAVLEHHLEILGEFLRVGLPGAGRVEDRVGREEDRDHRPHPVDLHLRSGRSRRLDQPGLELLAELLQPGVLGRAELPEGGDARRHGERVPGEGAGLVDRAGRGDPVHHVRTAAERADREAAADHLAEGDEVGTDPVDLAGAARRQPEAGHDLVDDEQRPVLAGDVEEPLEIPGPGDEHAHVAHHRLDDDAGDGGAPLGEQLLHRRQVVVGEREGVAGHVGRDARRVGEAERLHARSRPSRAADRRRRGSSRRT